MKTSRRSLFGLFAVAPFAANEAAKTLAATAESLSASSLAADVPAKAITSINITSAGSGYSIDSPILRFSGSPMVHGAWTGYGGGFSVRES